jgi:hypothetical protein
MSAAVLPFFRFVRSGGTYLYHCRACDWIWHADLGMWRNERMLELARHLAEEHSSGPLGEEAKA